MAIANGEYITRDEILENIHEEDIFEKYLGIKPTLSWTYTNPLRTDKKAGCRFYYDSRGRLIFYDFSRRISYDCFNVVQSVYNCSFYNSIKIIARDFNLSDIKIGNEFRRKRLFPNKKKKTIIKITSRNWEKKDFDWWNKYHIDEVYDTKKYLKFMDVYPCKSIWVNDEYFRIKSGELCYAYYYGKDLNGVDNIKLYFPLRTYNRFINNCPEVLQGHNKLPLTGDNLIITKSYKDVICLRLFKIYSVSPSSENVLLTEDQFIDLYNRFDNIYSLMDNDRIGMRMAWELRKRFEITPLLFPKDMKKDFSDNLEELGIVETQEIINYYKEIV